MSIDYSLLKYAKGTPKVLQKRQKKTAAEAEDAKQREICHQRSGRRCEAKRKGVRCRRRATENHHLKGGRGRRNVGVSRLALWRIDLCLTCHQDVHAGLLAITGPMTKPVFEERTG